MQKWLSVLLCILPLLLPPVLIAFVCFLPALFAAALFFASLPPISLYSFEGIVFVPFLRLIVTANLVPVQKILFPLFPKMFVFHIPFLPNELFLLFVAVIFVLFSFHFPAAISDCLSPAHIVFLFAAKLSYEIVLPTFSLLLPDLLYMYLFAALSAVMLPLHHDIAFSHSPMLLHIASVCPSALFPAAALSIQIDSIVLSVLLFLFPVLLWLFYIALLFEKALLAFAVLQTKELLAFSIYFDILQWHFGQFPKAFSIPSFVYFWFLPMPFFFLYLPVALSIQHSFLFP